MDPAALGGGGSACATGGPQHCAAAGVDTMTWAVPAQSLRGYSGGREDVAGPVLCSRAIGRAPPELSVLSQLRI